MRFERHMQLNCHHSYDDVISWRCNCSLSLHILFFCFVFISTKEKEQWKQCICTYGKWNILLQVVKYRNIWMVFNDTLLRGCKCYCCLRVSTHIFRLFLFLSHIYCSLLHCCCANGRDRTMHNSSNMCSSKSLYDQQKQQHAKLIVRTLQTVVVVVYWYCCW